MELKVSRPIQILVLVLVIAGVAGVASMTMLGKGSPAAAGDAQSQAAQIAAIRAKAHGTSTTAAPAATTPAKSHKATSKPATTPAPAAKPTPKPKVPKPTVAANGLPMILADALHAHRIVVVSIFDPQDQTDAISYAEARAGAGDAHAGFLGVSVLDDTVTSPLTTALPGGGLLPVPGLLVYRAPGVLIQRIDGFADRDAVAQVAAAARTAEPMTTPTSTTAAPTAAAPVATAAPATTP